MFTGIIRHMGEVTAIVPEDKASVFTLASSLAREAREGDSVAVNGACLTVLTTKKDEMMFRLMQETLQRINLGDLTPGVSVNLERPVAAGERFDGHFVMGHVDGVCEIQNITVVGSDHGAGDKIFTFHCPSHLMPYLIEKGSVTLDGVSLTVVKVFDDSFTVSMMPYTLEHTTFGKSKKGDKVNVEVDMIGKYVQRYMDLRESRSW